MAHLFQCIIYTKKGVNIKDLDTLLTTETFNIEYIPNRVVERISPLEERYAYYKLYSSEIPILQQHPNIEIVEAPPGDSKLISNANIIPLKTNISRANVVTGGSRSPAPNYDTFTEYWPDSVNSGLYWHTLNDWTNPPLNAFHNTFSSSLEENDKFRKDIKNAYDGEGVDLVILDTMVPYHYEFLSDPNIGFTYGDNGFPLNLAENNPTRFTLRQWAAETALSGTIDDPPSHYTTFSIENNIDSHGTQVGSVAAGNNHGWARKSNLYYIWLGTYNKFEEPSPTSDQTDEGYEYHNSLNLIKHFHLSKSLNPSTGYKRPTVVVCSTSPNSKIIDPIDSILNNSLPTISKYTHINQYYVTGSSLNYAPALRFDLYSIISGSSNPQSALNSLIHTSQFWNNKNIQLTDGNEDEYYIVFKGPGYNNTFTGLPSSKTVVEIDITHITGSQTFNIDFTDINDIEELVYTSSYLDFATGKSLTTLDILANKIDIIIFSGSSGFLENTDSVAYNSALALITSSLAPAFYNALKFNTPGYNSEVSYTPNLIKQATDIKSIIHVVDIGNNTTSGSLGEKFKTEVNGNSNIPFSVEYIDDTSGSLKLTCNQNINIFTSSLYQNITNAQHPLFPTISNLSGNSMINELWETFRTSITSSISTFNYYPLGEFNNRIRSNKQQGIICFSQNPTPTPTIIEEIGDQASGPYFLQFSSSFKFFNDFSPYLNTLAKTELGLNPLNDATSQTSHPTHIPSQALISDELADLGIILVRSTGNDATIIAASGSSDDPYMREGYYHPIADTYYTWDQDIPSINYIKDTPRYVNRIAWPGGNSTVEVGGVGCSATAQNPEGSADQLGSYITGALSHSFSLEYYSNIGPRIDILGLTGDIAMARATDTPSYNVNFTSSLYNNIDQGVSSSKYGRSTYIGGTSFSSPQIAGMACLYKQIYPHHNVNQFKDFLIKYQHTHSISFTNNTTFDSLVPVTEYPTGSVSNGVIYRPAFRSESQDPIGIAYWPYSTKGGNISFTRT